jgi:hypothetical protein
VSIVLVIELSRPHSLEGFTHGAPHEPKERTSKLDPPSLLEQALADGVR